MPGYAEEDRFSVSALCPLEDILRKLEKDLCREDSYPLPDSKSFFYPY